MFSPIISYWSAMDCHSKREVLEIWIGKMLSLDFFFSTGHQLVNNLQFLAKWWRDILRDLLTQYLYFRAMSSLIYVCQISIKRRSLARFPFTINSFPIEFVQQWLRAAIVKGFLSFEDEWFKVIVRSVGRQMYWRNSPGGHQKVMSCVQHHMLNMSSISWKQFAEENNIQSN